jgi:hypothetical protein
MRTKEVTVNEVAYPLTSLSCVQVDEIIFANVDLKQDGATVTAVVQGTKRTIRDRVCPAIAASLNNAVAINHRTGLPGDAQWFLRANRWDAPDGIAEEKWATPESVSELLYDESMRLYGEIMILTGLRATAEVTKRAEVKVQPEGEETATSVVH